jgi:hypothetical protein
MTNKNRDFVQLIVDYYRKRQLYRKYIEEGLAELLKIGWDFFGCNHNQVSINGIVSFLGKNIYDKTKNYSHKFCHTAAGNRVAAFINRPAIRSFWRTIFIWMGYWFNPSALNPHPIIPIHYEGWKHFNQGPEVTEQGFAAAGLNDQSARLNFGEARDFVI